MLSRVMPEPAGAVLVVTGMVVLVLVVVEATAVYWKLVYDVGGTPV